MPVDELSHGDYALLLQAFSFHKICQSCRDEQQIDFVCACLVFVIAWHVASMDVAGQLLVRLLFSVSESHMGVCCVCMCVCFRTVLAVNVCLRMSVMSTELCAIAQVHNNPCRALMFTIPAGQCLLRSLTSAEAHIASILVHPSSSIIASPQYLQSVPVSQTVSSMPNAVKMNLLQSKLVVICIRSHLHASRHV